MTQQTQPNEVDPLSNQGNSQLSERIQEIVAMVQSVASDCNGDTQNLLTLLRTLETLHRQIRCEMFEPSLPNTRNTLYQILKEIEETGGWPYIERMKLQQFLKHFSLATTNNNVADNS